MADASLLSGKTILLVEDNADSADLLSFSLRSLGAVVIVAPNVSDAQTEVIRDKVDLILCDIALPDSDGVQFVTWLRSLPPQLGSRTPCIAITAFSEEYPPAYARGFNAYMRKPLDVGRLATLIDKALADTRG